MLACSTFSPKEAEEEQSNKTQCKRHYSRQQGLVLTSCTVAVSSLEPACAVVLVCTLRVRRDGRLRHDPEYLPLPLPVQLTSTRQVRPLFSKSL